AALDDLDELHARPPSFMFVSPTSSGHVRQAHGSGYPRFGLRAPMSSSPPRRPCSREPWRSTPRSPCDEYHDDDDHEHRRVPPDTARASRRMVEPSLAPGAA